MDDWPAASARLTNLITSAALAAYVVNLIDQHRGFRVIIDLNQKLVSFYQLIDNKFVGPATIEDGTPSATVPTNGLTLKEVQFTLPASDGKKVQSVATRDRQHWEYAGPHKEFGKAVTVSTRNIHALVAVSSPWTFTFNLEDDLADITSTSGQQFHGPVTSKISW
jgi:hypothetical protein